MVTGLRADTYNNLQLNAGIFLMDFNYSTATDASSLATLIATAKAAGTGLLGATRGGGTFSCTPVLREVQADGVRSAFKGGTICDGWQVSIRGTLIEIDKENLQTCFGMADKTTSGNITTITVRNDVKTTDYHKLCWIGDTPGEGLMLIELSNALNRSGVSFSFRDRGEGTLPFQFIAHQDTVTDQTGAPCKVLLFKKATTP